MFPLLALGLLGAGAYGQQVLKDRRQEQLTTGMQGLLGAQGQAPEDGMGPPTQGTGLLADPGDVTRQMQFAMGLMKLPGGAQALQSFQPMMNQAIQSKQWTADQARQASQYAGTEARLTDQFMKQFGLQQDEARALAAQRVQQQENWQRTFDANAAEAAERRRVEGERLAIARGEYGLAQRREARADAEAARKDDAGPKLPQGYGLTQTATGPSAMPIPGTEPYAKAKTADEGLSNALNTVDLLMDQYLGKESTENGEKIRRGGVGSEWFGPGKASMAGKRGAILAAIGAARDAGVLQEGEYKRFEEQLPGVSDVFTSKGTWEAGYKEIRRQLAAKQEAHRRANPWLVPPPPPGFK